MTYVGEMHENVFCRAHCWENFRLLSETSLRVNSYCATWFHNVIRQLWLDNIPMQCYESQTTFHRVFTYAMVVSKVL